jgi:hypothetical protein
MLRLLWYLSGSFVIGEQPAWAANAAFTHAAVSGRYFAGSGDADGLEQLVCNQFARRGFQEPRFYVCVS